MERTSSVSFLRSFHLRLVGSQRQRRSGLYSAHPFKLQEEESCPSEKRAASAKPTPKHCGFVEVSPFHVFRDGEGDLPRKWKRYQSFSEQ
jgi:hypothetical protein